jgi:predicted RNA-binding Zn ribbon-like protein
MTSTPKQRANLKRGQKAPPDGLDPDKPRIGHMPASVQAAGAAKAQAVRDGMVEPSPDERPVEQWGRMHRKLTVYAEQLLDRAQRSLAPAPPSSLMDVLRELRQTSDRYLALVEAEGQAAALDAWLADLEARLGQAAPKLAKALGLDPLALPEPGGVLAASDL